MTSSVTGNAITATMTSPDAGKFRARRRQPRHAGHQERGRLVRLRRRQRVHGPQSGGSYTITLATAADDVTHITALPMRSELISVTGDGTDLSFTLIGEGRVVVDLKSLAGATLAVSGATVVSQVGDILTLDLGAIGSHTVAITQTAPNVAPIITSNGGGDTAALSFAENGTGAVTTVTASDTVGQTLTYALAAGGDAESVQHRSGDGRLEIHNGARLRGSAGCGRK